MITDQLTTALCHTLMHSLWQGVILAAVAGGIIPATRKTGSALRYNLLISAMVLFALGVLVTFAGQFRETATAATVQPIRVGGIYVIGTTDRRQQQAQRPGVTDGIENYLNDHRNTIVLVWFLIICARSLQLGVGLYGTYRIKRIRVSPVKDHWRDRMQQLARGLGITRTIALLESGLARAPMVVGHLKPVILVPIGLLTALSTIEVEAILIHELAHIKRRDYLVNLLQSLMEIVFFFNPAVLWISRLIKTERENCCDDLAVAQDGNKVNYIRALVSCEEYKASVPPYAMAFSGGKHTLLHRVKRIANDRNHSLNRLEKTILAGCLVGVGFFVMAFSSVHHPARTQVPATPPTSKQPASPAPASPSAALPTAALPTPVRRQHQPVRKDSTVKPQPSESTTPQPATGARAVPDPGDTLEVDPYSNTGYNNRPYRSGYSRYADQNERYKSDAAKIKIDLINEGLVSDTNHIHFTINDKEFILNGVRQSPAVFQRYKDEYCRCSVTGDTGWSWTHGTER